MLNEAESLSKDLFELYLKKQDEIRQRLTEFKSIEESDVFYELCYCLCTPQSKAENAYRVVEQLKAKNFIESEIDVCEILRNKNHYIRFHFQKTQNLLKAKSNYPNIKRIIESNSTTAFQKRDQLAESVRGFGLKEASHFLRNIGIFGPAILDRHTLKHLALCNVYHSEGKSISKTQYIDIENRWLIFCDKISIPIEEMDLLFWSAETGVILK